MTTTPTPPVAGAMDAGKLIAEVRKALGAVTNGPWEARKFDESQTAILAPPEPSRHALVATIAVGFRCPSGEDNAALIINARNTWLAALCDQLDAALRALEAARGENETLKRERDRSRVLVADIYRAACTKPTAEDVARIAANKPLMEQLRHTLAEIAARGKSA